MKKLSVFLILTIFFNVVSFAVGLKVAINSNNVQCNDSCDGNATALVSGGTGSFAYKWSNGVTNATTINLCAATYTCTVTDNADLSTATAIVTITEPPPIIINITSSPAYCNQCSGEATIVNFSGGTGSLSLSPWSNNTTGLHDSLLCAGSYSVTVIDAAGCMVTPIVIISNISGPYIDSLIIKKPTCGKSDGSILPYTIGGTSPFSWSVSNGSPPYDNLPAGAYTVSVTDAMGCMVTSTTVLNCVTGINELDFEIVFSLYPNPAANVVTLETTTNKSYIVQITNLLGEIIYSSEKPETDKIIIDVGTLPKGIYIVQLKDKDNNTSSRRRLVVQ